MIAATLLLGAALLAVVALARRCHVLRLFADLARTGRRSARIMAHRGASEFSRERAARILAVRLMTRSLTAGGALALVALPLIAVLALGPWIGVPTRAVLVDPVARLFILSAGICLAVIRILARNLTVARHRLQPA